jgi:hypothetical protein
LYVLLVKVRKTHCAGRKHKENVKAYYQKWMEEQAQSLIDATTAAFKSGQLHKATAAAAASAAVAAAAAQHQNGHNSLINGSSNGSFHSLTPNGGGGGVLIAAEAAGSPEQLIPQPAPLLHLPPQQINIVPPPGLPPPALSPHPHLFTSLLAPAPQPHPSFFSPLFHHPVFRPPPPHMGLVIFRPHM